MRPGHAPVALVAKRKHDSEEVLGAGHGVLAVGVLRGGGKAGREGIGEEP